MAKGFITVGIIIMIIIISFISSLLLLVSLLSQYQLYRVCDICTQHYTIDLPVLKPMQPFTGIWHYDTPPIPEDYYCMALNIYFEARNQSLKGQYAVADVVMYRLEHYDYPNTICGVIKDGRYYSWNPKVVIRHKCQFSWHCDGKSDEPINARAFMTAEIIAKWVIDDPEYRPMIGYALFYHADYVTPDWAATKEFIGQIDDHRFYNSNR